MLVSCFMSKHYSFEIRNKGVREYQRMINYFLVLDRLRGASYGELALRYKLDRSNISKRVRGVLNCHQNRARKKQNQSNQAY